jgi:hypothetical protein
MSDIIEFLKARIAEDERAARNASPGPWTFSDIASVGGGTIYDPTVAIANVEWDTERVDSRIRRTRPDWQADATGDHIARHNPTRVLAECAAKRAIIEQHSLEVAAQQDTWRSRDDVNANKMDAACLLPVLRTLAAVYADHPDYQQEWAL